MEVQVELSKIIVNEKVSEQIIVLKELDGLRSFPMVIGMGEILALERRLKGLKLLRPMTHDLLEGVIEALGGTIEKVVITDLSARTFYAALHVRQDGSIIQIDCRPSDALALTAGLDVPIFADEDVLDQAQI